MCSLIIAATLLWPTGSHGEESCEAIEASSLCQSEAHEEEYEPGLLPTLAAIVPGVLLHGSGVYVAGDEDAGLTLLALEGAGLATLAAGVTLLSTTGASRKLAGSSVTLAVSGVGLFLTPMLIDLYGASVGGTDAKPPTKAPGAEVRLGYRYVDAKLFDYQNLSLVGAQLWFDRWRLGGVALVAMDDENARFRAELDARVIGPTVIEHSSDGSALDLCIASSFHDFGTEGFYVLGVEAEARGRYDLARLGRPFRGSFVEGHLGYGLEFYGYDLPGLGLGEDTNEQLLAGFGWGLYLGEWPADHGEVSIYYDHRRDGYEGGVGPGFAGHFGLRGGWFFTLERGDALGLHLEAKAGSATMVGMDLSYRWGTK